MSSKYNIRYAENWPEISRLTKRLTGGLCCYPGCNRQAAETHHVVYCDPQGNSIAGRERPGLEVFPLCLRHHEVAHLEKHWRKDTKNPVLGNCNTPEFYRILRRGWKEKVSAINHYSVHRKHA
jgi:hypothetical protein